MRPPRLREADAPLHSSRSSRPRKYPSDTSDPLRDSRSDGARSSELRAPTCVRNPSARLEGFLAREPTRCAMKAASSFTNPMSADPRVCCHVSPMKNRPAASVTPRWWTMPPSSSLIAGMSIQEKSDRYPVAQTIASMSCSLPSSKTTRRPAALVSRFLKVTPERRSPLGLDPMSTSRFANFRPSRESVLTFMNPIAGQPPEEILAEQTLRQRRDVAGRRRDQPSSGRCEFLGDLEAGVAASHHEHSTTLGELSRVAIVGAMDLEDRRRPGRRRRAGRRGPGMARSQRRPGPP